ncbi:MAG: hypothetical protein ACPL7K_06235, partial [Armatimonadota bacterium]
MSDSLDYDTRTQLEDRGLRNGTVGSPRWLAASALLMLFINIIILPIFYYRQYHPDIHTVHHFGRLFLQGEDVFRGSNPYLPSSMLLWAPFGMGDLETAWFTFKLVTMAVVCGTLIFVYRVLVKNLAVSGTFAWLCLLNIGLLAGFTPKSGNPGNIAGPLAVAGVLLAEMGYNNVAGFMLGTSLALKYPI